METDPYIILCGLFFSPSLSPNGNAIEEHNFNI